VTATPSVSARCVVGVAVALVLVLTGCLRRADFEPPPIPMPVEREGPLTLPDPPAGPLGAGDAIRVALARNPDVRSAAARLRQAEAAVTAANAAFLPELSAKVTYLIGDAPSAFLFTRIDARRLPPNVDFNDPGQFSSLGPSLALRLNVWNGGRDQLRSWSSVAGAEGAAAAAVVARNALAVTVAGAWLDARAARANLSSDDASIRTLESQTSATRIQVEGGAALRTDLLSLEVRLAEARTARLHDETQERLALAALRELLALPPDATLAISETGPVIGPLPVDRAEALARAYARRPDGLVARRAVEQANLDLETARRAWLPRLDVESRLWTEIAQAHLSPRDPDWTVGVALSMSLFDGGLRGANVQRALAALDQVAESDRSTLLRIAREVESAYLHLHEARARLDVVTHALALAGETLRLVTTQYRGGAATITRFLDAEGTLARARAAHVNGMIDVARAEIDAAHALGAFARDAIGEAT
jgi:outer membrane protein